MTQTKLYSTPTERGSCAQACVASIFEIPEAMAPAEREVYSWTGLHYPGLQFTRTDHEPQAQPAVPVGHYGYWIASVHTQTEGFTDGCGRCWEFEGNENCPPLCDPPRPCPFCGEPWGLPKGIRPGYHAIVMRNGKIEHDPNPNCDWAADRVFVGACWNGSPVTRRASRPACCQSRPMSLRARSLTLRGASSEPKARDSRRS